MNQMLLEAAPMPLLLNVGQVARLCNRSVSGWWALVAAGKAPAPVKLGSKTCWRAEEIRAWIDAGCPDRQTWEQRGKTATA